MIVDHITEITKVINNLESSVWEEAGEMVHDGDIDYFFELTIAFRNRAKKVRKGK